MKNKKGNVLIISLIIIIIVITAGVIGYIFAKKSQNPAQEKISTSLTQSKTYNSKIFGFSINIPVNWKSVMPGDGSLVDINENMLEGYLIITSPDKKEQIAFMEGKFDALNHKCLVNNILINNQEIKRAICNDVQENEIPGLFNYEYIGKNLMIILNAETPTTKNILSTLKFTN